MSLPVNTPAVLVLATEDLRFLEDSLQRDAVGLLQHPEPGQSAIDVINSRAYRQNREIFGKVWDALYAAN